MQVEGAARLSRAMMGSMHVPTVGREAAMCIAYDLPVHLAGDTSACPQ